MQISPSELKNLIFKRVIYRALSLIFSLFIGGFIMNMLAKLSNEELEFRLKDLVSKERKLLHVILEHIKEVDTRKLYLQRAYPSIYEYLVKELGYSGSAAMRRLEAARLLKEVPLVSMKIQEGSLNLSQIGELTRMVKEKKHIDCI